MLSWFLKKRRRKLTAAELRRLTMQFADVVAPRTPLDGHTMMVGGSGGGKSTALRILLRSVLKYPSKKYEVINGMISDPLNDLDPALTAMNLPLKIIRTNVIYENSCAWDMCGDITDTIGAIEAASTLFPDEASNSTNKFYDTCPRIIASGVMREFINLKVKWTFRHLYLISMDTGYCEQLFKNSTDPGVRFIARLFNHEQGNTKANIESSLLTKFSPLEPYAALSEHCKEKFSLKDFVTSNWLLLAGGDPQNPTVANTFNYTLFSVAKKKLIGQMESTKRFHLVAVDEATELNGKNPADELVAFLERGRARGIRTVLALQTPEQLVKVYGRESMNIITGLCRNKMVFRLDDLEACKWASEILGHDYGYEYTNTVNIGGNSGPDGYSSSWGRGANETYFDRPRLHPDAIRNLPPGNFKNGIHGYAVLAGSRGVDRWRFFLSPKFLAEKAVKNCPTATSHPAARRPDWQMKLAPLAREEVEALGLTYHEPKTAS